VRRGWTLVCDDYLEFDPQQEGITIIPGSRDLWLWPDSIAAAFNDGVRLQSVQDGRKKRVQLAGMEPVHPIRLGCVYLLTPPEHTSDARIRIDAAPASEAFYEVVRQAFRLDEADRKLLAHQFGYVKWLVESLPIWRLSYPRDFTIVQAVAGAVNDHLQSSALASFPSHVSPGPQHPPRVMY
jgi:hypothetical protein